MNMQSALPAAPVMSERRVALIGALLAAIGPISMALFTPAMPEIVEAFATEEAAVKMTMSLYFGGFAFAQLVCGPLSDAFGRRPVTIAFMGIYLAASIFALLAPTIELLITARFLQGVGGGGRRGDFPRAGARSLHA
jgi:DHA1 family bicyclomycin/chloramphenicol resistance-like MFS transporter